MVSLLVSTGPSLQKYFPALGLPDAADDVISLPAPQVSSCSGYVRALRTFDEGPATKEFWPNAPALADGTAGATRLVVVASTMLARQVPAPAGQACVEFAGWRAFKAEPRAYAVPLRLPAASATCQQMAGEFNEAVRRHEAQHARDMRAVLATVAPPRPADPVACASTEAEAHRLLTRRVREATRAWGVAVTLKAGALLHDRPEGQASNLLAACRALSCPVDDRLALRP